MQLMAGQAQPSLRVTAVGIGYLGLTHAVCMADPGHQVLAIDVDEEKVAKAGCSLDAGLWHAAG